MKNKKGKKYSLLLLLLLGITIGYAALSTTLKINGSALITKNNWGVYWDNPVVTEGSVSNTLPTLSAESGQTLNTIATWTVNLNLPGDFYEFTLDAVNNGTIDAMITDIEDTVTPALPSYIKYEVTYVDGGEIQMNRLLAKKSGNTPTTEAYKVRVEFLDTITPEQMNAIPEGGLSYTFTYEVTYSQADSNAISPPIDMQRLLANIKANPSQYKPQEQTLTNDIGVDKYGNIVNMDWWIDRNNCQGEEDYTINTTTNEITLGKSMCGDDESSWETIYTGATSAVNVEDGEWKLSLPQYIYDTTTQEVYPVTEIEYIFGSTYSSKEEGAEITKFPDLPDTVTIIGSTAFASSFTFKNIVIPKQIKEIKSYAFLCAFDEENGNNTLTFEEGSQLERIGYEAFDHNRLTGRLVLPQTVTYIGVSAFRRNNLISVTFPSTAEYYDGNSDWKSFDDSTGINHHY